MTPVLFMLCSGFFHLTLASNRLRFFSFNKTANTCQWNSARDECININGSLVTIYDEEDATFVYNFTLDPNGSPWLGLHRNQQQHNNVSWSNGVPFTFHVFNMSHVNVTQGKQICEAIENNAWKGFNCSDRKPFMCSQANKYILIEKTKNWCQAQDYCRKHFDDLVSINSSQQNEQVIEKGKNKTFWIGLMHDEWHWEDRGCSTYRNWDSKQPNEKLNCTILQSQSLYTQSCHSDAKKICSKGSVRIKVIKERLTWEQAFDYCKANHSRLLQIEDAEDQEAVKQWLSISTVSEVFWIGLRQSRMFGFWIWSDKTVAYNNWKNGKIPQMPMSNHCGVIKRDNQSWSWSDESCWLPLPFLCEEDISYMKYKTDAGLMVDHGDETRR